MGITELVRGIELSNSTDPGEVYGALQKNPEIGNSVRGPGKWRKDGEVEWKYFFFRVKGRGPKDHRTRNGTSLRSLAAHLTAGPLQPKGDGLLTIKGLCRGRLRISRSLPRHTNEELRGSPMADLIATQGLTKRFGGLTAVNQVNFAVQEGQVAGVIGPNGSGKTTLFNLLSGFFPPTEGTIAFQGQGITTMPPYQRVSTWHLPHLPTGVGLFFPGRLGEPGAFDPALQGPSGVGREVLLPTLPRKGGHRRLPGALTWWGWKKRHPYPPPAYPMATNGSWRSPWPSR